MTVPVCVFVCCCSVLSSFQRTISPCKQLLSTNFTFFVCSVVVVPSSHLIRTSFALSCTSDNLLDHIHISYSVKLIVVPQNHQKWELHQLRHTSLFCLCFCTQCLLQKIAPLVLELLVGLIVIILDKGKNVSLFSRIVLPLPQAVVHKQQSQFDRRCPKLRPFDSLGIAWSNLILANAFRQQIENNAVTFGYHEGENRFK